MSLQASCAISKEQTLQCAQAEISLLLRVCMTYQWGMSWREGGPAGFPLGAVGWHGAKHPPLTTCRRDALY